jgi:sugar phosphate isomerase/epimerase
MPQVRQNGDDMLLSSNFMKFHNELGIRKTIDIFAEAGFRGIDFNADLEEYYTDAHDEAFYKEIRRYAEERGISFLQTHAPFPSSYTDEAKTEQRFFDIVNSMRHSAWLGADMVVVHPCNHVKASEPDHHDRMLAYNLEFYRRLIPYAKELGVRIAIENIHGCITATPEGLLELLDLLESKVFTICFDVGHALIAKQNPADMIRALGARIGCTHIHDNDGVHDSHTLPYYGTIDWESVMQAFAESGYTGSLNYESGAFVKNAPIAKRAESARYMAQIGMYLIERFHHYKG